MRVGIDLGTTYSSVAYFDEISGKPVIIKNKYGHTGTPSVLCFEEDGTVLYGEEAKELQEYGDENTIAFYKRYMADEDFCPFFWGKSYSAEDLSGIFLRKLTDEISGQAGEKITEAVITVPAYFNDYQRKATERAGRAAGLKVLRVINEPTAAAIAFGLDRLNGDNTYLVYDLGGGTFDVTIVNISAKGIRVIGTDGNHRLGGKDWDDLLAAYIAEQFAREHDFNMLEESEAFYELLIKCEKAKKDLSVKEQTNISVSANGIKEKYTVTLAQFNLITESLMEATRQLCEGLLKECGMGWENIDGVLLVGGSTRMQMVHEFVRNMSRKEPVYGVNVDEAVALGAAVQAQIDACDKKDMTGFLGAGSRGLPMLGAANIIDVTAHALGRLQIRADRSGFFNDIMIPANSSIPCAVTKPTLVSTRGCKNGETDVYVLQGSSSIPLETTILEKQVVSGIETKGRKEVIVDITYHYDRSGTVKIEAKQKDIGKTLSVRSERLPEDLSWMGENPDAMMPAAVPVTVVACIDTSGSMTGYLEEAKEAAQNLVTSLDLSNTSVGVISFETTVNIMLKPTKDEKAVRNAIDVLQIGGGTEEPLTKAYQLIQNFATEKYIVVLTDGAWEGESTARNVSAGCRKEGIEVIAIGIGGGVNESFLRSITTVDDIDVLIDAGSMVSAFGNIGQEIVNRSSTGLRGF